MSELTLDSASTAFLLIDLRHGITGTPICARQGIIPLPAAEPGA
jgi:hypothetical protein